jgi:hypothetical protein
MAADISGHFLEKSWLEIAVAKGISSRVNDGSETANRIATKSWCTEVGWGTNFSGKSLLVRDL